MYLTYTVYALILALFIWGGKFAGFKKDHFHEDSSSLDSMKSLRGFAAIGVILHHISQEQAFQWANNFGAKPGELSIFVNAGYLFVAIFFFCSGFGLIKSLETKPDYMNCFLKKRVLKTLVIPYYVSIVIYGIARFASGERFALGGNGFWLYRGLGARLEWALLNYFIAEHIKDGYEFILPPHLLTYECGLTAGQFPKFEEDVFRLKEEGFQFLLPTAETALVNLHRGEIVEEKDLPQKMFAYTPCYRREAGSYRKEERGMIRGHQFDKVEMFAYTLPEQSEDVLKLLIRKACALVEGLGLHYRLSKLAAGDCSASMATTYDVELWIPSMGVYKECSSVSNAMDYQARRGNMKFRRAATKKTEFLHTLNGSGLATSRLLPAIVEQFQKADGSVAIPEVLRPFLGGASTIEPPAK